LLSSHFEYGFICSHLSVTLSREIFVTFLKVWKTREINAHVLLLFDNVCITTLAMHGVQIT